MQYIGIDYGNKRIGLALGDDSTKIATPFKTVGTIDEVLNVIKEENIEKVIIGKPYSISDPNFPIARQIEKFIGLLKNKLNISVEIMDERLTSKAADALAGNRKEKAGRDEIAAMLILQSYFDQMPCNTQHRETLSQGETEV